MPSHPFPRRPAALPAGAVLAMLAGAAVGFPAAALAASAAPRPAAQAVAPPLPAEAEAAGAAAVLAEAQDRAARAAVAAEDLKRALTSGHLTDPMPETDRTFGLASLRADYADAQRQAAGYRATLGDRHPTLAATEQLMADLRGQLLDGTRKALASAERDGADARADIAAAERRLEAVTSPRTGSVLPRSPAAATSGGEDTGSVAAQPRPSARMTSPLSLPRLAAAAERPARDEAPPVRPAAPGHSSLRVLALAVAAAVAASLAAAWSGLKLLRPRRSRATPALARRVEPALSPLGADEPVAEAPAPASPIEAVPVLQRLALPRSGEEGAKPAGEAAADLHATLRAAFGETADSRMTVLVAAAAGLADRDADAAAVALALAAAAAGRRPLLMEARAAGRLRGAFVPVGATPMLIEAGGTARTLYRLGSEAPAALLPSDAGEAEAATAAAAQGGTARVKGLDAFDTVILVGDDPAALAASADFVLIAAPEDASAAALAEAALRLGGSGRPCGAVLVAAPAVEPGPAARTAPLPRRRSAPAAAPAVRLGLRGSIEPSRRRLA